MPQVFAERREMGGLLSRSHSCVPARNKTKVIVLMILHLTACVATEVTSSRKRSGDELVRASGSSDSRLSYSSGHERDPRGVGQAQNPGHAFVGPQPNPSISTNSGPQVDMHVHRQEDAAIAASNSQMGGQAKRAVNLCSAIMEISKICREIRHVMREKDPSSGRIGRSLDVIQDVVIAMETKRRDIPRDLYETHATLSRLLPLIQSGPCEGDDIDGLIATMKDTITYLAACEAAAMTGAGQDWVFEENEVTSRCQKIRSLEGDVSNPTSREQKD
ncbi:hypothetical protein SeMB42_g04925 [Synchytrium endobioticum]|uniref:Uncharacterized protein n=1 Tax=Synchytrium endobioticum TaxID=286115 RepID=A0A507CVA7_9FUNG|nr:hypothetical protein SeLEV6574_g07338 [Synchytrium endobioticum]TPX42961.1 hypothetical protein SeMB42_g04925 [Synchytrium endobioticum]